MGGAGNDLNMGIRTAFDDICRIAARATKSEIVCIVSSKDHACARIRGAVGTNAEVLEGEVPIPGLDRRTLIVWPKLAEDAWFQTHALAAVASFASSLIVVKIEQADVSNTTYLALFNPKQAQQKDAATLALLSELSRVARTLLATEHQFKGKGEIVYKPGEHISSAMITGLQETASDLRLSSQITTTTAGKKTNVTIDPLTNFLMKSLVKRRTLKARNGHSYVTLRSWRQTTKDTQIDALRAIKLERSTPAVGAIALEIVAAVGELYPGLPLTAVVPIPCGHSGHDACLSVLLAAEVARLLSVPYATPLRGRLKKGSSHPKENLRLEAYKVVGPVSGTILLIDDVATSGAHIVNAMSALKKAGAAPLAIAWIGS